MWSSGCSVYVRVCLHSCACFAPQRTGASRSSVQWLTVLLSIADEGAVTLLCQYKQTRISLSFSEAHTHTHAQRASATTINPCRAISHPVLDIAMYSKPSSNKTVREIVFLLAVHMSLSHLLPLQRRLLLVLSGFSPGLWGDQFGHTCPEAPASNQYLGICQHSHEKLPGITLPPKPAYTSASADFTLVPGTPLQSYLINPSHAVIDSAQMQFRKVL